MMHWQAWYSEVKTFSGKDLSPFRVPKVLEGQHHQESTRTVKM